MTDGFHQSGYRRSLTSRTPIRQHLRSTKYTGLRLGEKMHEDLFGEDEDDNTRPEHPLVSHVPVPPISLATTDNLPTTGTRDHVRDAIAAMSAAKDISSRVG